MLRTAPNAGPNGTRASFEAGLIDDPRRRQLLSEPGPCPQADTGGMEAKQNVPI